MNASLNLSNFLCPEFATDAATLIRAYYPAKNLTFNNRLRELAEYGCQYGAIVDLLNRSNRYGAIGKWVAFAFGMVGSILALITFSRREYRQCVTMMYHRAINAIEIFNALLTLQAAITAFYGDEIMRYQSWAYFSVYAAEKLRNCLLSWVNLIVLWVAFERVLACLFSNLFERINQKSVAIGIIVSASVVSTAVFLPYGFGVDCSYDNKTATYKMVQSTWAKTPGSAYGPYTLALSILLTCQSCLLLLASVAALFGLLSMARRKRALAKAVSDNSAGSRELLKQCSLNIQLCILQMCETAPCIANVLLFSYLTVRYTFIAPLAPVGNAPLTLTYEEATANAAETITYLQLAIINGFGVLVSHFCRFYWYLMFSPNVRHSFWAVISKRNPETAVTPFVGKSEAFSGKPRFVMVQSQDGAVNTKF